MIAKTRIEQLICQYDWDCNTAIAIAKAESGLRCDAIGDGHLTFQRDGKEYGKSFGLFQVRHLPNSNRPEPSELLNCHANIAAAFQIYKASGFNPWSAYKNGAYKKFIELYDR